MNRGCVVISCAKRIIWLETNEKEIDANTCGHAYLFPSVKLERSCVNVELSKFNME